MKMKFKAHQSFFIRKGWLSKGLKAVRDDSTIFMSSRSKDAMDELGLGANQIVSLRYWLQAVGLVDYADGRRRSQKVTELGELVLEEDPYIEEIGTLWALHCNLVSQQEEAASWYFFFNEFGQTIFTKEDFTEAIGRYIFNNNDKQTIARSSLESDFDCIIATYIPHDRTNTKISPENVIDCPLGELGLLAVENKADKSFRKRPANLRMLPSLLVMYSICAMREDSARGLDSDAVEIRLETLLEGACSPGLIFNLDSVGLLTKLYELENEDYLRIIRTAGLDVVRLSDPQLTKLQCLECYYAALG